MPRSRRIHIGTEEFDPLSRAAVDASGAGAQAHYIVQLHDGLAPDVARRLGDDHGLRLDDYLSGSAYVERLSLSKLAEVKRDEAVRAVVPFEPSFKLAPGLAADAPAVASHGEEGVSALRVVLFASADPEATAAAVRNMLPGRVDVQDDRRLGGVARFIVQAIGSLDVEAIAKIEGVRWVEPVARTILDNALHAATLQSGTVGATLVWDHGLHGEGQIVGVIDGPLDAAHCWFRDARGRAPGPSHRKLVGLRDADPRRPSAHGTFVCGIVCGHDVNALGADANRGLAWAARLTFGSSRDVPRRFSLLHYLDAAAADGARIHTNSWHEEPQSTPQYNQTAADVDAFAWANEDNLVLASSGNTGESLGPPGTAKNALCVSACQGRPGEILFGDGATGPTGDARPRHKPEVLAPGCEVISARSETTCLTSTSHACASSWATPAAAACAALVRQYYTEGWYPTGARRAEDSLVPSGALMKATLLSSAVPLAGTRSLPSPTAGWGLIRLIDMLAFDDARSPITAIDVRHREGLRTGDVFNHRIVLDARAQRLKVTLVWTDPPAVAGSTEPLINDLDLVVSSPFDEVYRGNVFAGRTSVTGGVADDANTVEMVAIDDPAPGDWTVDVVASAVNVGRPGQGFALVIRSETVAP